MTYKHYEALDQSRRGGKRIHLQDEKSMLEFNT